MPIFPISISGGLNDATSAIALAKNEVSDILNWDYSNNPEGAQRLGHSKFNATRFKSGANPFRILGLESFAYGAGTFRDIFLGRASGENVKLYRVDTGVATQVSWAAGITETNDDYPFSFANMRNHLIMVNGGNPNTSWDGDASRDAQTLGIEAPTIAIVPGSQESGGNLSGLYKWIEVYYDSTSDVYSASSPEISFMSTTGAGGKKVTISVTVSPNARVNDRAIYRTLNTGQPPYYFVGFVGDNTATSFQDNIADSALVAGGLLRSGGQPDVCRIAIEYNGVVYLMCHPLGEKYARVYPSRPGRPEEFPATYQFDLGTGDGQQITGAWVVGNQLVVFKERSIWHITGNDVNNRATQHMNEGVGMKWPYGGVKIDDQIVFASEDGIYTWNTARAQLVENSQGDFPVKSTWLNSVNNLHPATNIGEEVRMAWQPDRNALYAAFRTTENSGPNDRCLAWFPRERSRPWSLFDFGFDCHGFWRQNYNNRRRLVFGSRDADGFIFRFDHGKLDRVTAAGDVSGTVASGTTTTLVVDEILDFAGDGLMDAYVWVRDSADQEQTTKILSNTVSEITVASWPIFTPSIGDSWAVGSIETSFTTGRSDLGTIATDKAVNEIRVRMEDVA